MRKEIELEGWYRKEHFDFFSKFDEPFFGITTNIDCTNAYKIAKQNGYSFFLYYLHKSLVVANQIPAFKYRIVEGKVFEYEKVNASPTINRSDNSFGFSCIAFNEDFEQFSKNAQSEIEKVKKTTGLDPTVSGENVIHFSVLPWINFTSLTHARNFKIADSCPKISFGKMIRDEERFTMPISIHVHHALMDGFHVGQYINKFQELMDRL